MLPKISKYVRRIRIIIVAPKHLKKRYLVSC